MSSGKSQQLIRAQQGATRRNNILRPETDVERYMRSRNELTQRQHGAVQLLLRGLSDEEAAKQLGVDRGTIYRWRKTVPFQRELDHQRRALWERSAGQLHAMVQPALDILSRQLASTDEKVAMRAAAVLLRFATPSRLGSTSSTSSRVPAAPDPDKQFVDDLIAYCDAPLPGQPGAPEDMVDDEDEEEDD